MTSGTSSLWHSDRHMLSALLPLPRVLYPGLSFTVIQSVVSGKGRWRVTLWQQCACMMGGYVEVGGVW